MVIAIVTLILCVWLKMTPYVYMYECDIVPAHVLVYEIQNMRFFA